MVPTGGAVYTYVKNQFTKYESGTSNVTNYMYPYYVEITYDMDTKTFTSKDDHITLNKQLEEGKMLILKADIIENSSHHNTGGELAEHNIYYTFLNKQIFPDPVDNEGIYDIDGRDPSSYVATIVHKNDKIIKFENYYLSNSPNKWDYNVFSLNNSSSTSENLYIFSGAGTYNNDYESNWWDSSATYDIILSESNNATKLVICHFNDEFVTMNYRGTYFEGIYIQDSQTMNIIRINSNNVTEWLKEKIGQEVYETPNFLSGAYGYKISSIVYNKTTNTTTVTTRSTLEADVSYNGCTFVLRNESYFYDPALTLTSDTGGTSVVIKGKISNERFYIDTCANSNDVYISIIEHPEIGDVFIGTDAYAIGENNFAYDRAAFSTGRDNKSIGQYSTTFGRDNIASYCGTAMGRRNKAIGDYSTTMGEEVIAKGSYSTAMNLHTEANGEASTAIGYYTSANGKYQFVAGANNIVDNNNKYAMIIGNGSGAIKSNALTVDWNGNLNVIGDIYSNNENLKEIFIFEGTISGIETYTFTTDTTYETILNEYNKGKLIFCRASTTSYHHTIIPLNQTFIDKEDDTYNWFTGVGYFSVPEIGYYRITLSQNNSWTCKFIGDCETVKNKETESWYDGLFDQSQSWYKYPSVNTMTSYTEQNAITKTNSPKDDYEETKRRRVTYDASTGILNFKYSDDIGKPEYELRVGQVWKAEYANCSSNGVNIDEKFNQCVVKTTFENSVLTEDGKVYIALTNNTYTKITGISTYAQEIPIITFTLPTSTSDGYISGVTFTTGEKSATLATPTEIKYNGIDCMDDSFVPQANKHYEIIISKVGDELWGDVDARNIEVTASE